MLDTETERVGRFVDGKLEVEFIEDAFSDDNDEIKRLEKELDDARTKLREFQERHILGAFREAVREFAEKYDGRPTLVLMGYRDVNMLCEAYNEEIRKLQKADGITREMASSYDDNNRKVDGIRIKKGCDQDYGQIRMYSFE